MEETVHRIEIEKQQTEPAKKKKKKKKKKKASAAGADKSADCQAIDGASVISPSPIDHGSTSDISSPGS